MDVDPMVPLVLEPQVRDIVEITADWARGLAEGQWRVSRLGSQGELRLEGLGHDGVCWALPREVRVVTRPIGAPFDVPVDEDGELTDRADTTYYFVDEDGDEVSSDTEVDFQARISQIVEDARPREVHTDEVVVYSNGQVERKQWWASVEEYERYEH